MICYLCGLGGWCFEIRREGLLVTEVLWIRLEPPLFLNRCLLAGGVDIHLMLFQPIIADVQFVIRHFGWFGVWLSELLMCSFQCLCCDLQTLSISGSISVKCAVAVCHPSWVSFLSPCSGVLKTYSVFYASYLSVAFILIWRKNITINNHILYWDPWFSKWGPLELFDDA